MFRLMLNLLLQCFMCFLLLWLGIVYSYPTTDLALNDRYQRDTSETEFSQGEELDLVLQKGDKFLQFEICCKKDANDPSKCSRGSFLFCFPTTKQKQSKDGLFGCGPRTCSYKVTYSSNNEFGLGGGTFTTSEECFKGKIDDEHIYAIYKNGEQENSAETFGCPLDIIQPGNRLVLNVTTIPDGVTVTATNAQKYVEPTTLPPSTAPPTAETTNTSKEASSPAAKKEESGMSDALKYSLMGVGIFVFILIAGGSAFAIYWFCFKKKKSSKPAPPVTVAKIDTAATKQASAAPPIMPSEVKPKEKKKAEKEIKVVEDSKHAPSTVVPSSAAPVQPPPPPTVSKEPSAVPSRLELQKSSLPGPSLEPSSVINPPARVRQDQPPVLPPATPTIADLIGRVGRRYRVAGRKYFDTFDRIQTPHYEGIFESMIRNGWITEDQALKVKKEKFIRPPSEEELKLFAAPISVMYQLLEEMIDDATYSHNKTQHDENAPCMLIVNEFHTYFVSLYAVVVHYAKYFKVGKDVPLEKCSVPLLLGIAMDRSQTESLRRRALVIMTRDVRNSVSVSVFTEFPYIFRLPFPFPLSVKKVLFRSVFRSVNENDFRTSLIMTIKAVDLTRIFTEAQCIKMPYPLCVICLSYQLDRYLVDNVDRLHTYSSPNNSECTKSDGGQQTGGAKSVADGRDGGGKESSSASKVATKTSVSKEVVDAAGEKKNKMKKKAKKH